MLLTSLADVCACVCHPSCQDPNAPRVRGKLSAVRSAHTTNKPISPRPLLPGPHSPSAHTAQRNPFAPTADEDTAQGAAGLIPALRPAVGAAAAAAGTAGQKRGSPDSPLDTDLDGNVISGRGVGGKAARVAVAREDPSALTDAILR